MIDIDFSQITHAAERRTNSLKSLTALLEDLPEVLDAAAQVKDFMNSIELIYNDLDLEGRKMLPQDLQVWMNYRGSTRGYANEIVNGESGGLQRLASVVGVQP